MQNVHFNVKANDVGFRSRLFIDKLWYWKPLDGFVTCICCRNVLMFLHDGDLHAVGWGEGPWALVTPVKAIRVGVGLYKKIYWCLKRTKINKTALGWPVWVNVSATALSCLQKTLSLVRFDPKFDGIEKWDQLDSIQRRRTEEISRPENTEKFWLKKFSLSFSLSSDFFQYWKNLECPLSLPVWTDG